MHTKCIHEIICGGGGAEWMNIALVVTVMILVYTTHDHDFIIIISFHLLTGPDHKVSLSW